MYFILRKNMRLRRGATPVWIHFFTRTGFGPRIKSVYFLCKNQVHFLAQAAQMSVRPVSGDRHPFMGRGHPQSHMHIHCPACAIKNKCFLKNSLKCDISYKAK